MLRCRRSLRTPHGFLLWSRERWFRRLYLRPRLDFRDLPAFDKAIATACFCGRPDNISWRMLLLITFRDFPRLSGIFYLRCFGLWFCRWRRLFFSLRKSKFVALLQDGHCDGLLLGCAPLLVEPTDNRTSLSNVREVLRILRCRDEIENFVGCRRLGLRFHDRRLFTWSSLLSSSWRGRFLGFPGKDLACLRDSLHCGMSERDGSAHAGGQ